MREHFVCVRITRMNGVDLNRFDFDYDATWNSFFLDEKLNVYSRYGGRDEGHPEARMSRESLLQTMREVLDVHAKRSEAQPDSRPQPPLVGRVPLHQPIAEGRSIPDDIPLLKQSHQGCIHCHQVREYRFLQANQDKTFDSSQLFDWPLPENLGIEFDRKHGHRVENVQAESAAAEAGVLPRDVIVQADDVPIRSEYDFRWAMKRAIGRDSMTVIVDRPSGEDGVRRASLKLPLRGDWNESEVGWRKSLRSVPFQFGFRAYALTPSQLKQEGVPAESLGIRVVTVRSYGLAKALKLEKGDVIVALAGDRSARSFERFQSDLLRRYDPGDTVVLTVKRDGRELELAGPRPDWHTDETSVP